MHELGNVFLYKWNMNRHGLSTTGSNVKEWYILLSFSSFYYKQIEYWHKILFVGNFTPKKNIDKYWISLTWQRETARSRTSMKNIDVFLATGCVFVCRTYFLEPLVQTLLGDLGEFGPSGCCFVRMIND